jgi:hypothetical protein
MSPSLGLQREGIRKARGCARVQGRKVRGDCHGESVIERAKAILKKIIRPNYAVVIPTRNSYPPPQPTAFSPRSQLPCDCHAKGPEEGGEKFIKNF